MKFTPDSGTVNMTFSQPDPDHKYSSTLALLKPEEIAIKIQIAVLAYPKKIKNYFKVFSKQIAQLVEYGGTGLGLPSLNN
jgi:hypothetical protein